MPCAKKILSLCFFFVVSGCATSYKLPASKPFSPEAEGANHASIEVGTRQFYTTTITTDNAYVLENVSAHDVSTGITFGLSGNYGIFPWLDVGISFDTATFPIYYFKAQLLGQNKANADTGNFSASVIGGITTGVNETNTANNTLFATETGTVEIKTGMGIDTGAQFGYRISKSAILTTGINGYWQTGQTRIARPGLQRIIGSICCTNYCNRSKIM